MQHLDDFATLAERYDGFIIDLWGVIHDGVNAFPHSVTALRRLREAGKQTLLLSNVPRPNATVQIAMRQMGIPDELYGSLLTSGEAVRKSLIDPPDLWWAELGTNVFHLGPLRDRPVLEGLSYAISARPQDAHFVLNTGPDDETDPTDLAAFEPVLQECRRHELPMICANPDLEVIRGGKRVLCAGALAVRYAEMGGDVRSLGKPDPRIYQPALVRLGLPPSRVLAIGDALRTDIAGATAAGLDSCWVLGGLHGDELAGPDGRPDPQRVEAAAAQAGLSPIASIPLLRWAAP